MNVLKNDIENIGAFLLLQCAWCFLFSRFNDMVGMLVEKCDQRADGGGFYPHLSGQFDWQLGWLLVYIAPVLAICFFTFSLLKEKTMWGWIAVLNIQVFGAVLAIVLILNSILTASWGIW